MHGRKGQLAEAVVFWIFYIILTGAVVYVIVSTPATVFSRVTDTQQLENAIFAERMYDKVAGQSALTQRVYPGILASKTAWDKQRIMNAFATAGTPRGIGFKLTLDGQEAYFDERFYKEAKPLSPVRYKSFVETRPVWLQDKQEFAALTIDQVYALKRPGS